MSSLDNIKCNRDKCLRKFGKGDGYVSQWCGVIGKEDLAKIKTNSKDCPLYCDKFFCYKTQRIVKGHENTNWISTEEMTDNYRRTYDFKAPDVKFSGLSAKGNEQAKIERDYEDKHYNTSNIVCPYCDYEEEDWWEVISDSDNDYENIECCECGREFEVSIHREISFSTNPIDESEDNE